MTDSELQLLEAARQSGAAAAESAQTLASQEGGSLSGVGQARQQAAALIALSLGTAQKH